VSPQMHHGDRRSQGSPRAFSLSESSLELVEDYPFSSTLLAFGVGLGVGVLIGQTIAATLRPEPQPLSRLDSLSQQVCDAVRNAVPEAIARHLPR